MGTILQFWKNRVNAGAVVIQTAEAQADQAPPDNKIDFSLVSVEGKPETTSVEAGGAERDWSNQELADLYRVRQVLANAGAPVITDRGLSDEGDPWFVFCGEDGEVFVHLCRIDGLYLLDSPNLEEPLRGFGFNDLVDGFMRRASMLRINSNVVMLRPREGLHLHPTVLLTALIWSIYMASDDLVGVAKADEVSDGHLDYDRIQDSLRRPSTDTTAVQDALDLINNSVSSEDPDTIAWAAPSKNANVQKINITDNTSAPSAYQSSVSSGAALVYSAQKVAISLSVIAATIGFLPSADAPEPVQGGTISTTSESSDEVAHVKFPDGDQVAIPVPASVVPSALSLEDKPASQDAAVQLELAASLDLFNNVVEQLIGTVVPTSFAMIDLLKTHLPSSDGVAEYHLTTHVEAAQPPPSNPVGRLVTSSNLPDGGDLAQYVAAVWAANKEPLKHYKLDDISLISSIDLSKVAGLKIMPTNGALHSKVSDFLTGGNGGKTLVAAAAEPATHALSSYNLAAKPHDPINWMTLLPKYDDNAREFIEHVLGKSHPVEWIALTNEMILLDMSAFDDASDVTYARSWVTEENSVISMIGHFEDFAGFGLA